MHNLSTNVSRSQYVDTGIQDAARHVMSFLNTQGVHIKDITDAISIGDTIWSVIKDSIWDYAVDYAGQIVEHPLDIPSWLPPVPSIDNLIDGVKDALNENQKIHDIFQNYVGGVSQAIDDILKVAIHGLDGFSSVDEILTFAYSAGDIYQNHCTLQYICWLRTYDSFYQAAQSAK